MLMRGTSATTLTFSLVPATSIFRSTLTAPPTETVTFAFAVLKPASSAVISYGAGGRLANTYWPALSVVTFARGAGADGFRRHGHAGQNPAGRIGDDAGDPAGLGLCRGCGREREKHRQRHSGSQPARRMSEKSGHRIPPVKPHHVTSVDTSSRGLARSQIWDEWRQRMATRPDMLTAGPAATPPTALGCGRVWSVS